MDACTGERCSLDYAGCLSPKASSYTCPGGQSKHQQLLLTHSLTHSLTHIFNFGFYFGEQNIEGSVPVVTRHTNGQHRVHSSVTDPLLLFQTTTLDILLGISSRDTDSSIAYRLTLAMVAMDQSGRPMYLRRLVQAQTTTSRLGSGSAQTTTSRFGADLASTVIPLSSPKAYAVEVAT